MTMSKYTYRTEHSSIVTALRRVLEEPDDGLERFIEEMMPIDVTITPAHLGLVRDVLGGLCAAVDADDAERWQRVVAAHAALYPDEPHAAAAPSTSGNAAAGVPTRPPVAPVAPGPGAAVDPSPWARGGASYEPGAAAPSSVSVAAVATPLAVPPPSAPHELVPATVPTGGPSPGRLEPVAGLADTSEGSHRKGPALPFVGEREAPASAAATSLEPHPAMGGTVVDVPSAAATTWPQTVEVGGQTFGLDAYARATIALLRGEAKADVFASYGIADEPTWDALCQAFQVLFDADPAVQTKYRRLLIELRSG